MTIQENDDKYLGQFIPLQYHFAMLEDKNRMQSFKAAIDYAVAPGSKVLDIGGGTGILSWFAAAKADKVWCVELNPDLVNAARLTLAKNKNGHKVEVVHANAFDYLPPEPVDVVICEMIHVAMLREKQVEVMESFKHRYLQRFGAPLPLLMPTAVVMAVQPLQQEFNFEGYYAPISMTQELAGNIAGCTELAAPSVYSILDFTQPVERDIFWEGSFTMTQNGTVSALRFITKNILAIKENSTLDWLNRYMALPLSMPVEVRCGDMLRVGFSYRAGDSIMSLQNALRAEVVANG